MRVDPALVEVRAEESEAEAEAEAARVLVEDEWQKLEAKQTCGLNNRQ